MSGSWSHFPFFFFCWPVLIFCISEDQHFLRCHGYGESRVPSVWFRDFSPHAHFSSHPDAKHWTLPALFSSSLLSPCGRRGQIPCPELGFSFPEALVGNHYPLEAPQSCAHPSPPGSLRWGLPVPSGVSPSGSLHLPLAGCMVLCFQPCPCCRVAARCIHWFWCLERFSVSLDRTEEDCGVSFLELKDQVMLRYAWFFISLHHISDFWFHYHCRISSFHWPPSWFLPHLRATCTVYLIFFLKTTLNGFWFFKFNFVLNSGIC